MKTKLSVFLFFTTAMILIGCCPQETKGPAIPAADRPELYLHLLEGKKVALVSNQTALLSDGSHLIDFLVKSGVNVVGIYRAPEHGFRDLAERRSHHRRRSGQRDRHSRAFALRR